MLFFGKIHKYVTNVFLELAALKSSMTNINTIVIYAIFLWIVILEGNQ